MTNDLLIENKTLRKLGTKTEHTDYGKQKTHKKKMKRKKTICDNFNTIFLHFNKTICSNKKKNCAICVDVDKSKFIISTQFQ